MKLFHYHARRGNFGDDLNAWLWDEILPGWREAWPEAMLVGVGTLINDRLPRDCPLLVAGSGCGYGDLPSAAVLENCTFVAVRGPRSADLLDLPADKAMADPAMLLPDLAAFRDIPRSGRPIFVPHQYSTSRLDWATVCDAIGVDYVSPHGDSRAVIRRLAAAPLILAESMHAAIIGDAFGTPWHSISTSPKFLPSKWRDWGDSLGLEIETQAMFSGIDRAKSLLAGVWPGGRATRIPHDRGHSPDPAHGQGPAKPPQAERPRQPAPSGPAPSGPGPTAPRRRRGGVARRVLKAVEIRQAQRLLAELAARPGTLSDRTRLAEQQARLRAALDETRARFTPHGGPA